MDYWYTNEELLKQMENHNLVTNEMIIYFLQQEKFKSDYQEIASCHLFLRFEPLFYNFYSNYKSALKRLNLEADDVVQEGNKMIFILIQQFDVTIGSYFAPYLLKAFKNYMFNLIRSSKTIKRGGGQSHLSLSHDLLPESQLNSSQSTLGQDTYYQMTPEDHVLYQDILFDFEEKLSPFEMQVIQYYKLGLNYEEIAGLVGGTAENVRNARNRARKKFSENLGI